MAKRILVATDLSLASEEAERWAASTAAHDAAEVVLVRVVAPVSGVDGSSPAKPVPDDELTRHAQQMAAGRGRGFTVTGADEAEAIVHAAEELGADVIVCTNTGMHGRKEFLLNNVPNRVSHLAHCTVVLVSAGHEDDEPHRPHFHQHRRPPMVPADPSMFEGRMLSRATEIGRVVAALGVREALMLRRKRDMASEAKVLRSSLEKLGPTFEKLGQMLSTRPDLLPKEFIDELAGLQDDVPPLSHGDVVKLMEQELHVPWEDVFNRIDPDPIAAGTIAQVHRAVLGDGSNVVVKVQRPTAEEEMCKDLALLQLFGERASGKPGFEQIVDLPAIIEHLSESLRHELDFTREAANIEHMREVLGPFARLDVPAVCKDYSTHRLLVMEDVQGMPVLQSPPSAARGEAARQLVESYFQQVLTAGFFHADPHPGNLMWWNDKIYLLDFGMVGEIDDHTRELLSFMLLAFWHEDVSFLGDVLLMLAEQHGEIEEPAFRAALGDLVRRYRHLALEQFQLGPMLQDMTRLCVEHGIRLPANLALIGKALGQMQLVAAQLEPGIDPFAVAGRFFTRQMTTRVRDMLGPQRLVYNAHKVRLRVISVLDSLEKLTGARPGFRPEVVFRGTERLEDTIRAAGRRLASAAVAAASFVVCGVTAGLGRSPGWVTALFGAIGGLFTVALLADLLRRR